MISELPFKSTIPELGKIIDGIEKAVEKILEVYETDFSTEKKDDDSPITQADIESNKIISDGGVSMPIPITVIKDLCNFSIAIDR